MNEPTVITIVTTPDGKTWQNKRGKKFAVAGLWPQPFGNYSSWIVDSWHDTEAAAKEREAMIKAYPHGNAPQETRILESVTAKEYFQREARKLERARMMEAGQEPTK